VPRWPFFWLSKNRVTELAAARTASGAVFKITVPSACRNVTSWTRNCTVRVRTFFRGMVYSPTRSRKKKAAVTKSPAARVRASFD
jgi:hypothetical protein